MRRTIFTILILAACDQPEADPMLDESSSSDDTDPGLAPLEFDLAMAEPPPPIDPQWCASDDDCPGDGWVRPTCSPVLGICITPCLAGQCGPGTRCRDARSKVEFGMEHEWHEMVCWPSQGVAGFLP